MITCSKCGKENQDHYKFCLGCGAELPRGAVAKPFAPQTPSRGLSAQSPGRASVPAPAPAPVAAPPAAAAPIAPTTVALAPPTSPAPVNAAPVQASAPRASAAPGAATSPCPQCAHNTVVGNRFCASCGYNLSALAGGPTGGSSIPAPVAPVASVAAAAGHGIVLTALRADGTEAGTHRLPDTASVTVGRDTGSIFAGDSYLSPRHATFTRRGNQLVIKDEGSLNGVYVKLKPNEPQLLEFGDIFRIGQEIIRFEELKMQGRSQDGVERFGSPAKGYIGRLALVIGRDTTGNAFPIPERGVHCGRERGDILFSEDGYVSGLHCRIARGPDGRVYLTDVGSSNGSFVRLRGERALAPSDILLMGQQLFRVDY
ncbi:MAG TPA: FHA domain-containing protein [Polyangiaceae bacterium]|nr:FHA domain-containing protein [Polyangiaceae bacterium]